MNFPFKFDRSTATAYLFFATYLTTNQTHYFALGDGGAAKQVVIKHEAVVTEVHWLYNGGTNFGAKSFTNDISAEAFSTNWIEEPMAPVDFTNTFRSRLIELPVHPFYP